MKWTIFLLVLVLFVNCQKQNISKKDLKKEVFQTIVDSLPTIEHGFSLVGNGLSKFAPLVFDAELNLIANPLLKKVSDSALILLSEKYSVESSKTYFFVGEKKVGNSFLLTLMQDDTTYAEYWMKLNLFSTNGHLHDTITFAGEKVYFYKMYGKLDKNLNVETRSYHNVEIDTTNPDKYHYRYFATEIKKRYVIQDTCFKLVETLKERALFTDVSDRKIVARVDTLKYYY